MVAVGETTSEPGLRPVVPRCRVAATYPQGGTGIPAGEMNYPGAAAHMRPAAATGFRGGDATSGFGLSPNALNVNGADTYQFVGSDPVGATDATGQNATANTLWNAGSQVPPFDAPAPPVHPKCCDPNVVSAWRKWVADYQKAKTWYSTMVFDRIVDNNDENANISVNNILQQAELQITTARFLLLQLRATGNAFDIEVEPVVLAAEARLTQLQSQANAIRSDNFRLESAYLRASAAWMAARWKYLKLAGRTNSDEYWYSQLAQFC